MHVIATKGKLNLMSDFVCIIRRKGLRFTMTTDAVTMLAQRTRGDDESDVVKQ